MNVSSGGVPQQGKGSHMTGSAKSDPAKTRCLPEAASVKAIALLWSEVGEYSFQ